jgi:predicted metallopeptidase
MISVASRRPNFNQAVRALIRDVAARLPEFSHLKASRIMVVAGEARRASRGSIKPLAVQRILRGAGRRKPLVIIRGRRMLYCITLRPLFFRSSTPQARIGTILHELYHISPRFDGTLDEGRRHANLGSEFPAKVRPLLRRYLRHCPLDLWNAFAYDGEVRVHQWLERPSATYAPGRPRMRRVYTEAQLFAGRMRMITRKRPISGPANRSRVNNPQN